MKKLKSKLISVVVAITLIFGSLLFIKSEWRNVYNIDASVENEFLQGEMLLEFKSEETLSSLSFCLYPNAFKKEENVSNVCAPEMLDKAYPSGFSEGYIDIKSVKVNDKEAEFVLEENEQILTIEKNFKKNKKAIVEIEFSQKLPKSPMRYGYYDDTFNYGNWYPVLCPIEEGEAVKSVYSSNGDPFYSECADYFVSLEVPQHQRLATSGKIISKNDISPLKSVYKIEGKNIRDFAFVLSERFDVISKKVNDTIVYSYYYSSEECGKKMLDYAVEALEIFNKKFGEYPYSTYSVVEADFYIGGMEYPNLVLISDELNKNDASLEEVVVHETAHQWWYGIVGNNETKEAWLDEGLTQFSTALYYENRYGAEKYKSYMQQSENYIKIIFRLLNVTDFSIDRTLQEFDNMLVYDALVYDETAIMLDALRNLIGRENFDEGIRAYYNENKFKIATKQSFLSAMQNATGKSIREVVEAFLKGKVLRS